jgi:hypothetical protein
MGVLRVCCKGIIKGAGGRGEEGDVSQVHDV